MRSFVLIAVLAVAVNARPEPPSGYNYRQPAPAPAPAPAFNQNSGFASGGGYPAAGGISNSFANGHSNNFAGGQSNSFSSGFQQPHQPQTIVQKHIYVHVPPPEEEAHVHHAQQSLAQPRKHYKIIFIKAPSAPSLTQQIAAAQAQNEEKTLIYVLVKKPEDISIPEAPAPVQLPVSKPEVYFIKYKTQKDSAGATNSIGTSFSGAGGVNGAGDNFSSGFDVAAVNPQATYGAPIKKK